MVEFRINPVVSTKDSIKEIETDQIKNTNSHPLSVAESKLLVLVESINQICAISTLMTSLLYRHLAFDS